MPDPPAPTIENETGTGGSSGDTDFGDRAIGGVYGRRTADNPFDDEDPFGIPRDRGGGYGGPGGFYGTDDPPPDGTTSGLLLTADPVGAYNPPVEAADRSLADERSGIRAGNEVDYLDEYTSLTMGTDYIITGTNMTSKMTGGTINKGAMSFEFGDVPRGADPWQKTPSNAMTNNNAINSGPGIFLGYQAMSSVYNDPDQDIAIAQYVKQYYHSPTKPSGGRIERTGLIGEPTLMDASWGAAKFYGNVEYEGNVWAYSLAESNALHDTFGFLTTSDGSMPKDTYGAVDVRISNDLEEMILRIQSGYSTRKDITRSTSQTSIFDNFEVITDSEVVENISEETFGVSEGTTSSTSMSMDTPTGDY